MVARDGRRSVPSWSIGSEWTGWDVVTTLDARFARGGGQSPWTDEGSDRRPRSPGRFGPRDGEPTGLRSRRIWTSTYRGERRRMRRLFNRATQGQYPPGSVFKPVVMAAALESGARSSPGRIFFDEGAVTIGGRRIQNAGGTSYGRLAIDEALAYSSNVVFVRFAEELDPRVFHEFAEKARIGKAPASRDSRRSRDDCPLRGAGKTPVLRAEVGIGQGPLLGHSIADGDRGGRGRQWRLAGRAETGFGRAIARWVRASRSSPTRPVRVMAPGTAHVVKRGDGRRSIEWGTAREVSWPGGAPVSGKDGDGGKSPRRAARLVHRLLPGARSQDRGRRHRRKRRVRKRDGGADRSTNSLPRRLTTVATSHRGSFGRHRS